MVGRLTLRRRTALAASLLGTALLAWIVLVERTRGMDAGPGTDLGTLAWFIGIWLTMTAAMMLPSAAPTVLMFANLRRGTHAWAFVIGYLFAWTGYGLTAYVVYRAVRDSAPSFVAWDDRGPWVAGGALAATGLYQLTPLKAACLRHCRSPLHFLLDSRPGLLGAVRTGFAHGGFCVGCCLGLMLSLFALGVMSLFWMAVVAAAIVVEKTLPGGQVFARLLAVVLVALGIWVAASPAILPGLKLPTQVQMGMQGAR